MNTSPLRILAGMIPIFFCLLAARHACAETAGAEIGRPRVPAVPLHPSDADVTRTFDEFVVYFDYDAWDLDSARGGNSTSSPPGVEVISQGFEALRHNYPISGYKYDTRARDRVKVTGFADHLGSLANNEKIARKRAKAVRDYILSRGMDFANGVGPARITISSRVASQPTESRCSSVPHADEVKCLWLDRKVEIRYLRVDVEPHFGAGRQPPPAARSVPGQSAYVRHGASP
jgi:hypothetical protein